MYSRAQLLGLKHGKFFTKKDDDIIKQGYLSGEKVSVIAEKIGKSYKGTSYRAVQLGLRHSRLFTKEEDEAIKEGYKNGEEVIKIAEKIGRSYGVVQQRAALLGVTSNIIPWSKEED